jgi:hypothetical protein
LRDETNAHIQRMYTQCWKGWACQAACSPLVNEKSFQKRLFELLVLMIYGKIFKALFWFREIDSDRFRMFRGNWNFDLIADTKRGKISGTTFTPKAVPISAFSLSCTQINSPQSERCQNVWSNIPPFDHQRRDILQAAPCRPLGYTRLNVGYLFNILCSMFWLADFFYLPPSSTHFEQKQTHKSHLYQASCSPR